MISFDGVKVGDRVRLSAENTEPVEVVVSQAGRGWIAAENRQAYWAEYWDTVEVLSPPKPPLPTVPGLYASREDWVGGSHTETIYSLARDGEWSSDVSGSWRGVATANVPADLVRLVPEGEPSGSAGVSLIAGIVPEKVLGARSRSDGGAVMSARIEGVLLIREWVDHGTATFWCPGCGEGHTVSFGGTETWTWNEDAGRPTFYPSVLAFPHQKLIDNTLPMGDEPGQLLHPDNKTVTPRCHSFVRYGRIEYLGDCEHDKAGQTVDMVPLPDRYAKFVHTEEAQS